MKNERGKIKKVLSSAVALTMLLTALSVVITPQATEAIEIPEGEEIQVPTLRVYGNATEGAGDKGVCDPLTCYETEDLPYTDSIAPFDPQHPQAPVKDSITFNPVYLSETLSDDELLGEELPSGPYDDRIKHSGEDAEEKVYLRQWYEPWHWDKDVDGDNRWRGGGDGDDAEEFNLAMKVLPWLRALPTFVLQGKVPIQFESPIVNFEETLPFLDPDDEIYAAIMQEFTYLLVEPQYHQPTYGTPGNTHFVFPMGMAEEDVFHPYGYGLTSLDYDFDGTPDTVTIHSEKTLFGTTDLAVDFDGGQSIDPLDPDGYELTGDEMVILTTESKQISVGERWQFLDHMIGVVDTYENPASVKLEVWYTGDLEPVFLGYQLVGQDDMALFGRQLPATYIKSVGNGGGGTNLCDFPTGPWFVWVDSVFPDGDYAYLMIGRALGHTHTGMEMGDNIRGNGGGYEQDLVHGDPWWLKRFYVDGHEYNVVAIETYRRTFEHPWSDTDSWDYRDTEWPFWAGENIYEFPNGDSMPDYMINDLDAAWTNDSLLRDNDFIEGPPVMTYTDESAFKFITIRTPIPKSGQRQNVDTHEIEYAYRDEEYSVQGEDAETIRDWGYYHLIEQHSVRLQPYFIMDYLSVMPPFNYEHSIAKDVQTSWSGLREDPEEDPFIDPYTLLNEWDPPYDPNENGDGWAVPPQWIGDMLTRRPPITQKPGSYETFDGRTVSTEHMMYVEEDINPQYKGELKELYCDHDSESVRNGENEDEWWYVEQWHTLPDMYTEFILPESNEHYLLTSAFTSAESYGRILVQEKRGDDIHDIIWIPADSDIVDGGNRVKFWFNPMNIEEQIDLGYITDASDVKKYKCEDGIRIYGFDSEGAGDYEARDPITGMIPEIKPYTNSRAPFNPEDEQAPIKDSLTFDAAYMDEYLHGGEDLSELYKWISIEEADAREKVFHRMWYEPWHWAKDVDADKDKLGEDVPDYDDDGLRESWELLWFLKHNPEYQDLLDWTIDQLKNPSENPYDLEILDPDDEIYPALLQEFTYMYVNVWDFPDHGQPATSSFAFPIASDFDELGYWNPTLEKFESDGGVGDFGYGITTFDGDFDGVEDIVRVHSEYSLAKYTGIQWDTNGDGDIQFLDEDGTPLNGDEIVIFALEQVNVELDDFVMFLDHMIRIEDISQDHVTFNAWRTGGSTSVDIYPSKVIGSFSLQPGEMRTLKHGVLGADISAGGNNLGQTDGPWFVYVHALDEGSGKAVITLGRALGCTHTAMEKPAGGPDLEPGDPWYMKRFYVDGHEYSVVAIMTHDEEQQDMYKDEPYEFKYITIRTSIPKIPVIINQHSQRLQNYTVCMDISVMPPYNYEHTGRRDIVAGWTECEWWMATYFDDLYEWDQFMDPETSGVFDEGNGQVWDDFTPLDIVGDIIKNKPPLVIHINEEAREPQFKGELKEKYNKRPKINLTAGWDHGEINDGVASLYFNLKGELEGRSVSGYMGFDVQRINDPSNGDGDISGWFMIQDANNMDDHLFFDNDLFYGEGILGEISGWYDHSQTDVEIVLNYWYAELIDDEDLHVGYLSEWFLCFWAEFYENATLELNDAALLEYQSIIEPPGQARSWRGGWDPAGQFDNISAGEDWEVWMVEQWHTIPDQYTELGLPDDDQLYLLTSSWYAGESIIREIWNEDHHPYAYDSEWELDWTDWTGERVKFWYDPGDCEDIYVNTAWIGGEPHGGEKGDSDGDGDIDFDDFIAFSDAYDSCDGDQNYDVIFDFDDSDCIDFDDFIAFSDVYTG